MEWNCNGNTAFDNLYISRVTKTVAENHLRTRWQASVPLKFHPNEIVNLFHFSIYEVVQYLVFSVTQATSAAESIVPLMSTRGCTSYIMRIHEILDYLIKICSNLNDLHTQTLWTGLLLLAARSSAQVFSHVAPCACCWCRFVPGWRHAGSPAQLLYNSCPIGRIHVCFNPPHKSSSRPHSHKVIFQPTHAAEAH